MFTGIIETTGEIRSIEARGSSSRIRVAAPALASEVAVGDCRSLSGPGADRLAASRGARVLSVYSPRVAMKVLASGSDSLEASAAGTDLDG